LLIDNYATGSNSIDVVLTVNVTKNAPFNQSSIYVSPNGFDDVSILGGERDIVYSIETGQLGRTYVSTVSTVAGEGQWQISTPPSGSGVVIAQYDAGDDSIRLNVKGFLQITGTSDGIDFTDGKLADSFLVQGFSDSKTSFTIFVYSPDGSQCIGSSSIPSGSVSTDTYIEFSAFTGTCDFTNVGAVQLQIQAVENVDTFVTLFATAGPEENPSNTPSRSHSRAASHRPSDSKSHSREASARPSDSKSHSREASVRPSKVAESKVPVSPSKVPESASKIPSVSKTPVPASNCYCECPAFTCELIFDVDDDNKNHAALFFVDDDGFGYSKGYLGGGYGYYIAGNDKTIEINSAPGIAACYFTLLAAILAFF